MACPYCSATELLVVPNAKIDVSYAGVSRRTTHPVGNLCVCTSCGHMAMFLPNVAQWAAELAGSGVAHQRVRRG